MCIDITNPTPSIGWNNQERKSFLERISVDCVMVLALIHHLVVTYRQPMNRIVDLFNKLTDRYLIIEYVGKDDEMFQQLLENRKEKPIDYSMDTFKSEHCRNFKIIKEIPLKGMERTIFLMEKLK